MKTKDLVYLVVAVVILLAAGFLAFTQLAPKSTTSTSQVEIVGRFSSEFDQAAVAKIRDPKTAQDYSSDFDFKSGLQNPAPFGQ